MPSVLAKCRRDERVLWVLWDNACRSGEAPKFRMWSRESGSGATEPESCGTALNLRPVRHCQVLAIAGKRLDTHKLINKVHTFCLSEKPLLAPGNVHRTRGYYLVSPSDEANQHRANIFVLGSSIFQITSEDCISLQYSSSAYQFNAPAPF
jgi:hypothetical protein